MQAEISDRAHGCLAGVVIGDAMGAPASFLTRQEIRRIHGRIDSFKGSDLTDDTRETMIIAEALAESGEFREEAFRRAMKEWALSERILEGDLIGPATRKFLTALMEGKDTRAGARTADTNGSAMRVAPIGIRHYRDFGLCMKTAAESSFPSHGSAPAVAAACAVAVAVAAGVRGGLSIGQVMEEAYLAAKYGESVGFDVPAPKVSSRIALAVRIVEENSGKGVDGTARELADVLGAGMKAYESAPFSLGVFLAAGGDPAAGIVAAVNTGDDADTNGSICGALCGAFAGEAAMPGNWMEEIRKRSGLNLTGIIEGLLCGKEEGMK